MALDSETTDVEVTHQKYGRGRIVDIEIGRPDGVDLAEVYFYKSDGFREVAISSLRPAASVSRVEVIDGDYGLEIHIDDGFFEFIIAADGEGEGFNVTMKAGKAVVDRCHLGYTDFL